MKLLPSVTVDLIPISASVRDRELVELLADLERQIWMSVRVPEEFLRRAARPSEKGKA